VTILLIELAKDTSVLTNFVNALAVSDDANVTKDARVMLEKAGRLAESSGDLADPAVKEIATDFMQALENLVSYLPLLAGAWNIQIDAFQQRTSHEREAAQARSSIERWNKLIMRDPILKEFSKDDACEKLNDLVRLTDAVMKELRAIPELPTR
jgi:hypothetical protein